MIKQSVFFVVGTVVAICLSSAARADSISSSDILKISVPREGSEATASPFQSLPLHAAALHDNAPWTVRLIEHGLDVDTRDADGRTPLMVAAAFNSLEVAGLLLDYGADPGAADYAGGYTPLHFASGYGHVVMLDLLLSAGADISKRANNGQTPLHVAALYGRLKMIRELATKGIDLNLSDANGVRPIQYATIRLQTSAVDLVYRDTAIHYATLAGDTEMVGLLLAGGVDVNLISDHAGESPLRYAAQTGNPKMIELLLRVGADSSIRDSRGKSPLDVALSRAKGKLAVPVLRRLAGQ